MRFEHFPIMNRGEFGIERYDPDTNKVLIGGRGNVPRDAGTDGDQRACSRRASAWRTASSDKTVIRAGFGITNDPYPLSRPMRSPFPAVIVDRVSAAELVLARPVRSRPAFRRSRSRISLRRTSTSRTRSPPIRCSPASSAAATSSRSTSRSSAIWARASCFRPDMSAPAPSGRQ